jgi:hypothetical protein
LVSFLVAIFVAIFENSRLTKRAIDALEPRAKPFIAYDAAVAGFGVRVMPSGLKSFIIEYRPGTGGRGVNKPRMTLGRYGSMTPDQARRAALAVLAHVRLGADPQAEKSRQRASLTVAGLIDAFLDDHGGKLKPRTKAGYAELLGKVRAVHGGAKAEALSRTQVAVLHRSMSSTPYAANRMLAAVSSLYGWAGDHELLPEGHGNPAARLTRFKEQSRERFLTGEELARLGDALAGFPGDPFAVAAIRLLILTGRAFAKSCTRNGLRSISSAGLSFCQTRKPARNRTFSMRRRLPSLRTCLVSMAIRTYSPAGETARLATV